MLSVQISISLMCVQDVQYDTIVYTRSDQFLQPTNAMTA